MTESSRNIYEFDPKLYLSALNKPVLVLVGENDPMVPPSKNFAPMKEYLEKNADAHFALLPKANHMFWRSESGSTQEYGDLTGPPAQFSEVIAGDADHARLAQLKANRVLYAEGYFETIENFVDRYVQGSGPGSGQQ